ncbi:MAG: hypothetical protein JW727_04410 [Candidatus Aenigmarchaeota archaeon]|nr:hypothetical protein [Candidatus Aenigmarchaeota archaeon]
MNGFLYSGLMVLVLFALFSIMLVQRERVSEERETFSLNDRLMDMDASYDSIERSIHTLCDVSLRRAIISSENSVLIDGVSFFSGGQKAPDAIKQLMWNGTLPATGEEVTFMENNTLEHNLELLEEYYSRNPKGYNVSIDFGYESAKVGLYDAFNVFINSTVEVNISKEGVANLSRRFIVLEKVSILGFEDPLYLENLTGGTLSRVFNKSQHTDNFTRRVPLIVLSGNGNCYGELTDDAGASEKEHKIFFNDTVYPGLDSFCGVVYESGSEPATSYLRVDSLAGLSSLSGQSFLIFGSAESWSEEDGLLDVSNLIVHVREGSYINSSSAPSFFDALEGTFECTYCAEYGPVGLETVLDKNILSAPELHINVNTTASNTLHEYLQGQAGEKFGLNESSVDPTFYEFRLDGSSGSYLG